MLFLINITIFIKKMLSLTDVYLDNCIVAKIDKHIHTYICMYADICIICKISNLNIDNIVYEIKHV